MRLATVRLEGTTKAALLDGNDLVILEEKDVGEVLTGGGRPTPPPNGARISLERAEFATLLPRPSKVFCVGLNYRSHILERNRELPSAPTLFAKFAEALIGANDPIVLPTVSERPDFEVELAVVVGRTVHNAGLAEARDAIAGYTVLNDVTMRDWQYRTLQWLQGKTFESTTPVGPFLVSPDECDDAADLEVRCELDGELMQCSRTSELVFGPSDLVSYCSKIVTLNPGDLIATGTPGGVGDAREPPVYLEPGQTLTTTIEALGACWNRIVSDMNGA